MPQVDFYISTFIVDAFDEIATTDGFENYSEFQVNTFVRSEDESVLKYLKKIVRIAKKDNEEVIFILKNTHFPFRGYNQTTFFQTIFEASDLDFQVVMFDGRITGEVVHIKDNLFFISQVKELRAFVVFNSTFDLILNLDENESNVFSEMTLEEIMSLPFFRKVLFSEPRYTEQELLNPINNSINYRNKQRINLVIPFRNAEKYLAECCTSILYQTHTNFRAFFIDDASSDNSIEQIPKHEQFIVIRNNLRQFSLQNIYNVLTKFDFNADDVIAILDGDDTLYDNFSLSIVNNVYCENQNCLMSYSKFVIMKTMAIYGLSYTLDEFRMLRSSPWKNTSLRTFKFKVFEELIKQDLQVDALRGKNGAFFEMTYDMALMFPLMEISGFDNIFFIEYPLYFYRLYQYNDHEVNRDLQYKIELEIRAKSAFTRIF